MSVRSDLVWDVRGGGGPSDHREGGNVKVEAKTVDTITRLSGGAHSGVYDDVLEADSQDESRDPLE